MSGRPLDPGQSLLDLAANETGGWCAAGLAAFRFTLLLHASIRTWAWVSQRAVAVPAGESALVVAFALGVSICAGLALTRRYARGAAVAAAGLIGVELVSSFPGTANHVFLEWVCIALLAALDPDDPGEGPLLLASLRWVALIVLFHTGLQKVLGGYYFQGEFLSWAIAVGDRFAAAFSVLLPSDELARLSALDGSSPDSGPYRSSALPFLFASNAVYVIELVLPVLIVVRRTRTVAVAAAVVFVLALQVAAREVMFALLFAQLALLWLDGDWNRRAMPVFVAVYAYLVLYLLGIAPGEFLFGERRVL